MLQLISNLDIELDNHLKELYNQTNTGRVSVNLYPKYIASRSAEKLCNISFVEK